MRASTLIRSTFLVRAVAPAARAQSAPAARGAAVEAEALTRLGFTYAKSGQYSKAIEALKRAVRPNPGSAEGRYVPGLVYNDAGRDVDAVRAFEEALCLLLAYACLHGVGTILGTPSGECSLPMKQPPSSKPPP